MRLLLDFEPEAYLINLAEYASDFKALEKAKHYNLLFKLVLSELQNVYNHVGSCIDFSFCREFHLLIEYTSMINSKPLLRAEKRFLEKYKILNLDKAFHNLKKIQAYLKQNF